MQQDVDEGPWGDGGYTPTERREQGGLRGSTSAFYIWHTGRGEVLSYVAQYLLRDRKNL